MSKDAGIAGAPEYLVIQRMLSEIKPNALTEPLSSTSKNTTDTPGSPQRDSFRLRTSNNQDGP